ncbi:MAG: putative phage abortive infection protein [Ignavibacteria bacterium]
MKENKTFDKQFWKWLSPLLVFLIVILIFPFLFTHFSILDLTKTGQIGDTIGGTLGPFVAIAAAILTFMAFWVQYKANEQLKRDLDEQKNRINKENFEKTFFEMIRLYKENISEFNYSKNKNYKEFKFEKRDVIKEIFEEFLECYNEIKSFTESIGVLNFILPKYDLKIDKIKSNNKIISDKFELGLIDIAYLIVFYGVNYEGADLLKGGFLKKYDEDYIEKVLTFIKIKSEVRNFQSNNLWKLAIGMNPKDISFLISDMIENKSDRFKAKANTQQFLVIKNTKYYSGHQHRLGHYFRHLFQTYKFLNENEFLSNEEKYFYGKTLRAQLSTYEQSLLFINSISSLGMDWEFNFEMEQNKKLKNNFKLDDKFGLITKYNLIKNLPGNHFNGIIYKNFYPNVNYENNEEFEI